MATMKYFNVSSIPTAQSEEGTYYVKDGTGKIATYLVSSSIVQYIGGYPLLTTGNNEYIPMSQGATTTALNTLEDTIDTVREGAIGHWNIRKTYASIAEMNADKANPVDANGVLIKVGEIVTVINNTTPTEDGMYTYLGTTSDFKFQSSFNFQIEQIRSQNTNTAPSSKLLDDEMSNFVAPILNQLSDTNTEAELPTKFPLVVYGDASKVLADGIIWSYNGAEWKSTGQKIFQDEITKRTDFIIDNGKSNINYKDVIKELYVENTEKVLSIHMIGRNVEGFGNFIYFKNNSTTFASIAGTVDGEEVLSIIDPDGKKIAIKIDWSKLPNNDINFVTWDFTANVHDLNKSTNLNLLLTKSTINENAKLEINVLFPRDGYIDLNGNFIPALGWKSTNFLDVVSTEIYLTGRLGNELALGLAIYDKDKKFLNGIIGPINYVNLKITFDDDGYFYVLSSATPEGSKISIPLKSIFPTPKKALVNENENDFLIELKSTYIDFVYGFPVGKLVNDGADWKSSALINATDKMKLRVRQRGGPYSGVFFFNKNKVLISYISDELDGLSDISFPENTSFICISSKGVDFDYLSIKTSINSLIKYVLLKPEKIEYEHRESIDYSKLSIPSIVDCIVNKQFIYYTDNICIDSNKIIAYPQSSIGLFFRSEQYLHYTPTTPTTIISNLVKTDINADRYYLYGHTAGSLNIRSIDDSTGAGNKGVFFVGDSLIDQQFTVDYVKELFTNSNTINPIFIGTRGTTKHEGVSGAGVEYFLSSNSPFYFNGAINMASYFSTNKDANFPTATTIDYMVIALGTNDVGQGANIASDSDIEAITTRMKTLVDKVLEAFPNAKIAINLPSTGALRTYSYPINNFKYNILKLRISYLYAFDNGKYNANVTCVDSGSQISKEYGYDYADIAIDDIITVTEKQSTVGNGGPTDIHPNQNGYKQIGKAYYAKIRAFIAGYL